MRKKIGLESKNKISVNYLGSANLNEILMKNRNFISKEAKMKILKKGKENGVFYGEKEIEIDQQKLWLGIKKNNE